ncbi:hypothetical protein TNIN_353871 [Trichonephila inaurata madagascariensis]|uniref:C2H2-type domain-containing protein n=1 Tax=Trichonephila inaurata madagascariensis TaxID=2747483 RepID=A0A8X7C845_9ARAC|nr:hypothetical protein TNIN_353871 [Trichonephila inaurata madagascariensis]
MDKSKNCATSPSPVASRTRGMYRNIRAMVRINICAICDLQTQTPEALRRHMMSHTPSRTRTRALGALAKLVNAAETPVNNGSSSGNTALHDKFRELFPAEFDSSSSPDSVSPAEMEPQEKPANEDTVQTVETGENPAPVTLDDLASQLGAIFSPGKSAEKIEIPAPPVTSSETAPAPPTGTDSSTPQPLVEESILDMLLGSQPETLPEASPPKHPKGQIKEKDNTEVPPPELLELQSEWKVTGPPVSPPFPMNYAARVKRNLFKCPSCELRFYTKSKFDAHREEERKLEGLLKDVGDTEEKALDVPDQSDRDDFQSQKPRGKSQHRRGRKTRKGEQTNPPIKQH